MKMRSTLGIIIAVKESQPVSEEELKLALLVMSAIDHFLEADLRSLAEAVEQNKPAAKLRAKFGIELLERMFHARKKPPAEWLGPTNIPGNPEYEQRLATGKKLFEKATGQKL
jgi:hypothetical protein